MNDIGHLRMRMNTSVVGPTSTSRIAPLAPCTGCIAGPKIGTSRIVQAVRTDPIGRIGVRSAGSETSTILATLILPATASESGMTSATHIILPAPVTAHATLTVIIAQATTATVALCQNGGLSPGHRLTIIPAASWHAPLLRSTVTDIPARLRLCTPVSADGYLTEAVVFTAATLSPSAKSIEVCVEGE